MALARGAGAVVRGGIANRQRWMPTPVPGTSSAPRSAMPSAPAAPSAPIPMPMMGGGGGGIGEPVAPTASASPAMDGLRAAMMPEPNSDPAAGFAAGGGGAGLNPFVGRRTPPQAMRLLSQLARVY